MANAPEGWYADPTSPDLERWWDGEKWSVEHTRPKAPVAQPAEPAPVLEVPPSIPVGWYPIAGDPGTERYFDGRVWTMQVRPASASDADDVVPGIEGATGDAQLAQPQTPPQLEGSVASDSLSPPPEQSPSPRATPASTGVVPEPGVRTSFAKPLGIAAAFVLVAGVRRRLRRRRRR